MSEAEGHLGKAREAALQRTAEGRGLLVPCDSAWKKGPPLRLGFTMALELSERNGGLGGDAGDNPNPWPLRGVRRDKYREIAREVFARQHHRRAGQPHERPDRAIQISDRDQHAPRKGHLALAILVIMVGKPALLAPQQPELRLGLESDPALQQPRMRVALGRGQRHMRG